MSCKTPDTWTEQHTTRRRALFPPVLRLNLNTIEHFSLSSLLNLFPRCCTTTRTKLRAGPELMFECVCYARLASFEDTSQIVVRLHNTEKYCFLDKTQQTTFFRSIRVAFAVHLAAVCRSVHTEVENPLFSLLFLTSLPTLLCRFILFLFVGEMLFCCCREKRRKSK